MFSLSVFSLSVFSLSVFSVTEVLQLCDVVRNDTLPELGVRLEDHEGKYTDHNMYTHTHTHTP